VAQCNGAVVARAAAPPDRGTGAMMMRELDSTILIQEGLVTVYPAPDAPDYSAEGLIDIVVDFDPFYEQNLVKGMFPRTCTWLRNHMCYYPEGMNGFCGGLGWCPRYATQEPVDRGDGGGGSR